MNDNKPGYNKAFFFSILLLQWIENIESHIYENDSIDKCHFQEAMQELRELASLDPHSIGQLGKDFLKGEN